MSETKTYVLPETTGNTNNELMTMMAANGGMNGMWNNPFMYLIWLAIFRQGGFFGGDNAQGQDFSRQLQTLQEQMQDNQNSDLLMAGINGNTQAIQQAADRMGCNFNTLNSAIQSVSSGISQLGGQIGFSSERVINAINSGDAALTSALQSVCCQTQKSIIEQGYQNQLANERQTYQITNSLGQIGQQVQQGFCNTNFNSQQQSCELQNTIKDSTVASTATIIAKLNEMQTQSLVDKISTLQEKNSQQAVIINNAQQSALFNQMLGQAVAPLTQSLNSLTSDVQQIQSKMPTTTTVAYSPVTAVPNYIAYQYGLYGNTYNAWG